MVLPKYITKERHTHMIHRYETPCMDLQQIHQSGQCFRMVPLPEHTYPSGTKNGYRLISGLRVLRAWQDGPFVCLDCPHEDLSFWLSYLDMDRDYQAVIASIDRENTYLRAAAMSGTGIRILRQDPWEMIITFVISQQKTIPNIRQLVEALSSRYGTLLEDRQNRGSGEVREKDEVREKEGARREGAALEESLPPAFSFPAPSQLCLASLEDLMGLKLGYRAKYIHRLCQDAVSGRLDLSHLAALNYEEAMEYLTGFYGIGKKVANCVCLFGLHHIDAFPVDTWIEKILMEQYFDRKKYRRIPKNRLCETIVEDVFGRYSGCAGIMQQYIFYYERSVRQGRE